LIGPEVNMTLVNVHMDPAGDGRIVWWAESPEVPGFSAAADSLIALEILVKDAAREWPDLGYGEVSFSLIGDEPGSDTDSTIVTDQTPVENIGAVGRSRSELVTA
jgi:hypothetical protein